MPMKQRQLLVELPLEILFEILVRLSVKSLLLCKCVCKTLQNLIQNPDFVQNHLTRLSSSSSYNSRPLLILHFTGFYHDSFTAFAKVKDAIFSVSLNPPIPMPVVDKSKTIFIVGSCNGLILIHVILRTTNIDESPYLLILWNPVLRQSRYLPKPHDDKVNSIVYDFGFIPEINDYVVVTFRWLQPVVMVYKMSIHSWITIDCSSSAEAKHMRRLFGEHRTTVFLNGSFHWSVYRMNDIFYYNVKDEKIGLIKGVDKDRVLRYNMNELTMIDESLAMIFWDTKVDYMFEIWVMSDYNVEESWVLRFRTVENSLNSKLNHPVGYWTDGWMIIDEEARTLFLDRAGTFVLYNINTGTRLRLKIPGVERVCHITRFYSFMETLVPVRLRRGEVG